MVLAVTFAKAEFDYCTITKKHTMCGTDKGYGPKCGTVLGSGITNREEQEIIQAEFSCNLSEIRLFQWQCFEIHYKQLDIIL